MTMSTTALFAPASASHLPPLVSASPDQPDVHIAGITRFTDSHHLWFALVEKGQVITKSDPSLLEYVSDVYGEGKDFQHVVHTLFRSYEEYVCDDVSREQLLNVRDRHLH